MNSRRRYCISFVIFFAISIVTAPFAFSQVGTPFPPKRPDLPVVPPPTTPPAIEMPRQLPAQGGDSVTNPKIFVKEVRLVGNSAFTAQQLLEVTGLYANRDVTAEELEALRLALTYYYVNHGYATSGAIIEEQSVIDGLLTVKIIEGRLTDVQIEGTEKFKPWYFRQRIDLAAGPPLNVAELQQRLHLLQVDPRIQ